MAMLHGNSQPRVHVAPKSRATCLTNVPHGFLFFISSNLHRKMTSETKTMRILNYRDKKRNLPFFFTEKAHLLVKMNHSLLFFHPKSFRPELEFFRHSSDHQLKVVLALIQDSKACGFYIHRLETCYQQPLFL